MKTYDIIIRPIITERSMEDMAEKYTFKADKRANKIETGMLLNRYLM